MPGKLPKKALTKAAKNLRSKGREGDSILAHISPREARLLQALGGSGRRNPKTGLPEFTHEDDEDLSFEDVFGFEESEAPSSQSIQDEQARLDEEDPDSQGGGLFGFGRGRSTQANITRGIMGLGAGALIPGAGLITGGAAVLEALFGPGNAPDFLAAGQAGVQEGPALNEFGGTDIGISPDQEEAVPTQVAPPKPAAAPTRPKPPGQRPAAPPAAPRPTSTAAVVQARALAARRGAARARTGGRRSTIVTSPLGLVGDPSTTRKDLRGLNRLR
jgi:hypothetical protein